MATFTFSGSGEAGNQHVFKYVDPDPVRYAALIIAVPLCMGLAFGESVSSERERLSLVTQLSNTSSASALAHYPSRSAVYHSLQVAGFDRTVSRLSELDGLYAEENDGALTSFESLQVFAAFVLAGLHASASPLLGLTDAGEIYATWRNPTGETLSLHFLASSAVRYAYRNQLSEGKSATAGGVTEPADLSAAIAGSNFWGGS